MTNEKSFYVRTARLPCQRDFHGFRSYGFRSYVTSLRYVRQIVSAGININSH
jgi:hypothetical protein